MFLSIVQIRPEFLLPVVIVPAGYCFLQLNAHLRCQDKFLARLFAEHRDVWDALGGPSGWRWAPPRGTRVPPGLPSIYFGWLDPAEPSWLNRIPDLQTEYRAVREGARRWNFKTMPLFFWGVGLVLFVLWILERDSGRLFADPRLP